MRLTSCKRCNSPDLCWTQNASGKWILVGKDGLQHHCDDGKIKAVKCKYCNANDLYWAEEVDPNAWAKAPEHQKKAVLTESYGLPHACDERLAFIAKEKQDKKNKYEAEKKRINAHPAGICETCRGTGCNQHNSQLSPFGLCSNCHGKGNFDVRSKSLMLAEVRRQIWPNMQDNPCARRW